MLVDSECTAISTDELKFVGSSILLVTSILSTSPHSEALLLLLLLFVKIEGTLPGKINFFVPTLPISSGEK